jgi:hypothetical protein
MFDKHFCQRGRFGKPVFLVPSCHWGPPWLAALSQNLGSLAAPPCLSSVGHVRTLRRAKPGLGTRGQKRCPRVTEDHWLTLAKWLAQSTRSRLIAVLPLARLCVKPVTKSCFPADKPLLFNYSPCYFSQRKSRQFAAAQRLLAKYGLSEHEFCQMPC